jgi:hypothetical protein
MKKKGINLELLVQIFEKSFDPSASIEHDVQMPVITSKIGATRQCDIVIRQGKKSRETITIIEVQDRTSKPSRNDFGGWIEKMKEVGAQHLICVSKLGFTRSQKEKALELGSTIRLIKLTDNEISQIPLNIDFKLFNNKFDIQKNKFEYTKFLKPSNVKELPISKGTKIDFIFDFNSKSFTTDKKNYFSMPQLLFNELGLNTQEESEKIQKGSTTLKIPSLKNKEVLFLYQGFFMAIEFEITFDWSYITTEIPINILSYEQNEDGTLGWVAEGVIIEGNKKTSIKTPFEPDGNNGYIVKTYSEDNFINNKLVERKIY